MENQILAARDGIRKNCIKDIFGTVSNESYALGIQFMYIYCMIMAVQGSNFSAINQQLVAFAAPPIGNVMETQVAIGDSRALGTPTPARFGHQFDN